MRGKTVREVRDAVAAAEKRLADALAAHETAIRNHVRASLDTHQEEIREIMDGHTEAVKAAVTQQVPVNVTVTDPVGDPKALAAAVVRQVKTARKRNGGTTTGGSKT